MLGYITTGGRGESDILLFGVARSLRESGVSVAGAVQENVERDPARKCDMELHVLTSTSVVRISQNLGRHASGCRLDASGLERAVGLVEASLADEPDILIVNKFGKQEVDGHGFRPLIGRAIAGGIPVLTAVNQGNLDGFLGFAGGMGEILVPEENAILSWCSAQIA